MTVPYLRIQTNKQSEHITRKGFIKLQFLQKLSSQKPFWDEAILSSFVNYWLEVMIAVVLDTHGQNQVWYISAGNELEFCLLLYVIEIRLFTNSALWAELV